MESIIEWIFFKSIFGIVGLSAALFYLLILAKAHVPFIPNPVVIVGPLLLLGLVTVPSIPRYQFESKVTKTISGVDWIRILNSTRVGSLIEPLTWFDAPMGSITIAQPEAPTVGGFRVINFRYNEETTVRNAEPECANSTIRWSSPDKTGTLRYTTPDAQKMSPIETMWFCSDDWAKERNALYQEVMRRSKS